MDTSMLVPALVESAGVSLGAVFFAYINVGKPAKKAFLLYMANIFFMGFAFLIFGRPTLIIWNYVTMFFYCMFSNRTLKYSYRMFMSILCIASLIASDTIIGFTFMKLGILDFVDINTMHKKYMLIILSTELLVWAIISVTISMFHKNKNKVTSINAIFLINPVEQLIMIYMFNAIIARNKVVVKNSVLFVVYILTVALCIFSNILIMKISDNFVNIKFLEQKHSFIEYYNRLSTDYHDKIEENLMEIRKIRHDFNNSLAVIQSLIENNDLENASAMAEQLEIKCNNETNKYSSNNILDVILQHAENACMKKGIKLHIKCSVPKNISISQIDICNIAENLLHNAIEAVSKSENDAEKEIYFSAWTEGDMLFFKSENPLIKDIHTNGKKILTSKSDKKNHGFGLEIIKDIAESYDGDVFIDYDNDTFKIVVQLNIQ